MKILRFNERNLTIADLEEPSVVGGIKGDVLVNKLKQQIVNPNSKANTFRFQPDNGEIRVANVSNPKEIIDGITDGPNQTYDVEKAEEFLIPRKRYKPLFKVDIDPKKGMTSSLTDNETEIQSDLKGDDTESVKSASSVIGYKLNDISITPEFASSRRGTSLGTTETEIVESLQCLYCALKQDLSKSSRNYRLTSADFNSFFDHGGYVRDEILQKIRVNIDINRDLLEQYRTNWESTFIFTANALYSNIPIYTSKGEKRIILDPQKSYIFYQISFRGDLIYTIRNKFRSFVRRMNISKWTPSDMWVVEESKLTLVQNDLSQSQTIHKFNELIDKFFLSRELVGVSLKKVGGVGTKVIINKVTDRPTFKFSKARTSYLAFNSINVDLILSQDSPIPSEKKDVALTVRNFGGEKYENIQAEILGLTSRHGKISLTEINFILERISQQYKTQISLIPEYTVLKRLSLQDLQNKVNVLNDLIGRMGDKTRETSREKTPTPVRLVSKYQALLLANTLYKHNTFADVIVQTMMYYALAIENSQFVCPMYVRIL